MCGISGLFFEHDKDPSDIVSILAAMGGAHHYRGPDGAGIWADNRVGLGFVRLAITGDAIQGTQPIRDRKGGLVVFNGEVYDHAEILSALGTPTLEHGSDGLALAEILALYGPDGLRKIRGAFAGARYEPHSGRLILVRDAVGKKPLYYTRSQTGWVFASTLAALRHACGPFVVRTEAPIEYLIYRSIGGNYSAFTDVFQVPAGGWVEFIPDGTFREGRWWHPPDTCDAVASLDRVRQEVNASVSARLVEGAEMALFLSGGLDSSIIASVIQTDHSESQTFALSVGYDVGGWEDETACCVTLATQLKLPLEIVTLQSLHIPSLLEQVATYTEDPIQDPVAVATLFLARSISTRTKIALTGDGSDEIWVGYDRFEDAPENIQSYLPRTWVFSPHELGLETAPRSYLDSLHQPAPGLAGIDRILRFEVSNRLRNYHLARIDKILMSCSIEPRCPFLDVNVIDYGLSISAADKCRPGRRKALLADAYSPYLPAWLLERKKQPFSLPISKWLQTRLRDYAFDILQSASTYTRQFVDPRPYLEMMSPGYAIPSASAHKVWALLQLEAWHRAFATKLT